MADDRFSRLFTDPPPPGPRPGDVLEARVLRVEPEEGRVVVDLGGGATGSLRFDDLLPADLQAGAGLPVAVLDRASDDASHLPVSWRLAQRRRAWEEVERHHQSRAPLRGALVRRVLGGALVRLVSGVEGFLPEHEIARARLGAGEEVSVVPIVWDRDRETSTFVSAAFFAGQR